MYNLAQDQLSCQRRPRLHRWQRGRPFTLVRVCLRQIDILEVSDDSGSAKILRTFRLLRPLRALRAAGRFKNIFCRSRVRAETGPMSMASMAFCKL